MKIGNNLLRFQEENELIKKGLNFVGVYETKNS